MVVTNRSAFRIAVLLDSALDGPLAHEDDVSTSTGNELAM
jgi:hypothetical protein